MIELKPYLPAQNRKRENLDNTGRQNVQISTFVAPHIDTCIILMESKTIQLTVQDGDESYIITAYPGQYRSLMMMLYDQVYLEGFGECLGMGRCATCAVSIESSAVPLTQFNRNERVTLSKEGITDPDIHLSCQIVVDESLDGAVIRIYHPVI